MPYSSVTSMAGNQQVAFFGLPDNTSRHQPGLIIDMVDNYWGGAELVYGRAAGAIRQAGICTCLPTLVAGAYRWDFVEAPNTANLGRSVFIAMTAMTAGQFGWFLMKGITPINMTATIAADTTFGIVAAGQGGAVSAGKQILGARVISPATTTVPKTNCVANAASTRLVVPNSDGWFIGAYLSGAGIAAATVVVDIDPSGNSVTLNNATTAAINGTVTATYNNGVVFYNIADVNRPIAQGQIT